MRLKRKKLSIADRNNFDLWDINFNPKAENVILAPPVQKKDLILPTEFNRSVYIGQHVYIRPSYVVSLPAYDGVNSYSSLAFQENQKNLIDNVHGGLLSSKAIGKMKNAINWLLCSAETKKVFHKQKQSWFNFKINFITLTLPDTSINITNQMLQKQLLNPFFTYMRKYYSLGNYIWKLEFQKNGKLHVHFVCDTFIHHAIIRKVWNKLLGSNNYLLDFHKKFNHSNPNSTDVHSVAKVKNLAAYLAKYMSKNSLDLNKIKGRIWGCSQELSKANQTKIFVDRDQCHTVLLPLMNSDIEYKPIERLNPITKINKRIGEIFFVKYNDWAHSMFGVIKEAFNDTILELKNVAMNNQQLLTV